VFQLLNSLKHPGWRGPLPAQIDRPGMDPVAPDTDPTARDGGLRVGWGEGGGLLARRWQLSALSRARGAAGLLLPPARRAEPVVAPSTSDGWFPPSRIVHLRFDFFDVAITVYECCNWFLQMLHCAYRCLHQCFLNVRVHEVLMLQTFSTDVAHILYRCCNHSPPMSHLYSLNVADLQCSYVPIIIPHD
jgi:hypothetical protein